mmetsp:Transcript_114783/g.324402  ORF Transcript_114783/g.324402 Transcript_114783/m.324402 type:complete len:381 (+) Transcript_114783:1636-2778(+)
MELPIHAALVFPRHEIVAAWKAYLLEPLVEWILNVDSDRCHLVRRQDPGVALRRDDLFLVLGGVVVDREAGILDVALHQQLLGDRLVHHFLPVVLFPQLFHQTLVHRAHPPFGVLLLLAQDALVVRDFGDQFDLQQAHHAPQGQPGNLAAIHNRDLAERAGLFFVDLGVELEQRLVTAFSEQRHVDAMRGKVLLERHQFAVLLVLAAFPAPDVQDREAASGFPRDEVSSRGQPDAVEGSATSVLALARGVQLHARVHLANHGLNELAVVPTMSLRVREVAVLDHLQVFFLPVLVKEDAVAQRGVKRVLPPLSVRHHPRQGLDDGLLAAAGEIEAVVLDQESLLPLDNGDQVHSQDPLRAHFHVELLLEHHRHRGGPGSCR